MVKVSIVNCNGEHLLEMEDAELKEWIVAEHYAFVMSKEGVLEKINRVRNIKNLETGDKRIILNVTFLDMEPANLEEHLKKIFEEETNEI